MNWIMPIITGTFLLGASGVACNGDSRHEEAVATIKNGMPLISSNIRNETYSDIDLNNCILNYRVSGTYPVGRAYGKTFSDIDLSSLVPEKSKVGADSSDYIILFFDKTFNLTDDSVRRTSKTVVIDAASHDQAETLFQAFLRISELCRKK